ncbi:MATE family efflux transporter [uncultured Litoreibacter sp.]|uniref:MATE family efflux transporter n=1 Tax=uncultured Litoreibacter sp. TaxID=1392394 RepID=UPI00263296FA|nr:MATE family efflux transporter [uncultured Litoreibacter sp.]
MAQETAKFLEGNLFNHISVMSLTASVGLIAVFAVDFVDMIFISMLGNAALAAAVGYAGAILFFTTSFGIGMAIAAGALVSRALGNSDEARARQLITNSLVYGVAFGIAFSALVWMNLGYLTSLVGASGDTQALAISYLQIIVPSLPFLMIGMMGGAILRAYGDARGAMMATIYGGLVNAVLDPILIFGAGLDLQGAALASVVARVTIAATALVPIIKRHGGIDAPHMPALIKDFGAVFGIALPAILTQLATPIGQGYVTRAMAEFGEVAVAGMAIVSRITPISFAVIFALSGALGPIIGQNFGGGRHDRVGKAFNEGLLFIGIYVVLVSGLLFFLRDPIVALFQAEGIAVELIYLFCGPLALLFFFNGTIFVANSAFNNLGHPFYSTWVNWGRHTLGTIPFVMLFAWWLGAAGVLIGQAVGGVLFGVLAWWLGRRVIAVQSGAKPTSADPFSRQARLMHLLHMRR